MIDHDATMRATNAIVDLIASSMVTYILTEDKVDEWREWLRVRILAPGEKDPETLQMFQSLAQIPDEIVEDAVYAFVAACQDKARIMQFLPKGFFNG
jgi:hypothetical protein